MSPARRARATATFLVAALIALGLAACESSSESSNNSSESSNNSSESSNNSVSSADYVADAQRVTQDAMSGLVYSDTNSFTPADQLAVMKSWLGPTQSPPVPQGASIAFVSCGATVCNQTAEAGAEIADRIGFETSLVNLNGSADIQNINQAMSSAIALRPNAIVGICITATQVADKLEEASKAGILTVSTCDPTETGAPAQFDAAADYANGLSAELLGWGIVANSDGKANVVAIKDEAYPAVVRKIGNLVRVVEDCTTCAIKTVTWQITDAANSAKAANILTGIINANPTMDTLVLPYSVGMFSAVQAVASSGRDIKIYADDLDAVNLQLLRDGSVEMVSSVDPQLAMYQSIDQVIRGLNGSPYVEPVELPYLAHLYTSEDSPPDTGVGAFLEYFDYVAVYNELWNQP